MSLWRGAGSSAWKNGGAARIASPVRVRPTAAVARASPVGGGERLDPTRSGHSKRRLDRIVRSPIPLFALLRDHPGEDRMNRRNTIIALIALGAVPIAAKAQQAPSNVKIGVLFHGIEADEAKFLAEIRRGLRDLGYVEGRNIAFENRYPDEQPEKFNSFAADLVRINVNVLIAVTPPAALAAQRATGSIPIVFLFVPDAVERKLIRSLGRPGGNITGLSNVSTDIAAKRLQLLKEVVPALSRVAVIVNPNNSSSYPMVDAMRASADKLRVTVRAVEVRGPEEFESAFSTIVRERENGIVIGPDGMLYAQRARIATLALERRMPTIFTTVEAVESGGLMAYGPNTFAMFYRSAYYVDKILKGAKPGDLPVEEPTKFDLVLNGKTASALGLTIPPSILARADRLVQ